MVKALKRKDDSTSHAAVDMLCVLVKLSLTNRQGKPFRISYKKGLKKEFLK